MGQRWKLSPHARLRASQMGLSRRDILTAIKRAEVVYPGSVGHPPGRLVACWSKLAVVFTPATKTIITILWRGIGFVRPPTAADGRRRGALTACPSDRQTEPPHAVVPIPETKEALMSDAHSPSSQDPVSQRMLNDPEFFGEVLGHVTWARDEAIMLLRAVAVPRACRDVDCRSVACHASRVLREVERRWEELLRAHGLGGSPRRREEDLPEPPPATRTGCLNCDAPMRGRRAKTCTPGCLEQLIAARWGTREE